MTYRPHKYTSKIPSTGVVRRQQHQAAMAAWHAEAMTDDEINEIMRRAAEADKIAPLPDWLRAQRGRYAIAFEWDGGNTVEMRVRTKAMVKRARGFVMSKGSKFFVVRRGKRRGTIFRAMMTAWRRTCRD